jgi:hypothetical protein
MVGMSRKRRTERSEVDLGESHLDTEAHLNDPDVSTAKPHEKSTIWTAISDTSERRVVTATLRWLAGQAFYALLRAAFGRLLDSMGGGNWPRSW